MEQNLGFQIILIMVNSYRAQVPVGRNASMHVFHRMTYLVNIILKIHREM